MYKFWSVSTNYLGMRQSICLLGLVLSGLAFGQSAPQAKVAFRMPASYVPDDDVIVKPEDNEISFYQQYVGSDDSSDVVKLRNQIKVWNDNETFAQNYGLRTTLAGSPYFAPTEEQKWNYFENKYLRYLRRKGEQPFKDMPKNWYQEYRASNEVDTIDEMEARFQKSNKKASGTGNSGGGGFLPKALQQKEFKITKKTKFIFQPRVDQGLVIVGFTVGKQTNARAWVGVNGRTEVNFQHKIDSAGFRVMYNYFTDTGEYFTSLDQRIIENVYARYTSSFNPLTEVKDDTVMLLYGKSF